MAIDEFTMKVPAEMEPVESPPSPPILKPHEMTVSYLGPHMPTLLYASYPSVCIGSAHAAIRYW